jgi:putative phosphoribosyl transferase
MTVGKANVFEREIEIPVDVGQKIRGILDITAGAKGIIIFAHGGGSGRLSPRNRYVAGCLTF